ncbi:hypothetical protein BG004_005568 [Podila humilis]|nr:hypothetical protein BG004_005568 [Podila humilis]
MAIQKPILTSIAVLSSLALLFHQLFSCEQYVRKFTPHCLLTTEYPAPFSYIAIPILDRIACVLAYFYVDSLASSFGRFSLALVLNFAAAITFFYSVEGSRRGSFWTLLACTPLSGFLSYGSGVGIYFPMVLVPLMVQYRARIARSSHDSTVSLARVLALLATQVVNIWAMTLPFLVSVQDSSEESKEYSRRVASLNLILGVFAWMLYTPITVVFGKILLTTGWTEQEQDRKARMVLKTGFYLVGAVNMLAHFVSIHEFIEAVALAKGGSFEATRDDLVQQVLQVFSYGFRAEQDTAAAAYFFLVDALGCIWGMCLLVAADADPNSISTSSSRVATMMLWFVASLVLSPGAALMFYAVRREDKLQAGYASQSHKNKSKLQ